MSIVVTGATGALGRLVVDTLLTTVPAGEVVAVVRDKEKAAALAARGEALRIADYSAPETLTGAYRTRAREQLILDSGLPYTFLRNGWYTENYTANLAPVLEHRAVVANAGEGRIASADRADYAAAAAAVLTGDGHLNTAYELSGDTAWSLAEYAALLSELTGEEIAYQNVPAAAHQEVLVGAGLPEGFAAILVDVDEAIGRGRLAGTSGDLARLIGRPTTPLAETMRAALSAA